MLSWSIHGPFDVGVRRCPRYVNPNMQTKGLVQRALVYSGANVIGQAALVVQAFVVRRILPPEVLGIWSFAAVVRQFVMNFDPGILAAAGRELPIAQGRGDQGELNQIRSTALWSVGIQATLMATVIIAYAWVGAGRFSNTEIIALHLAAAFALVSILVNVYMTFFQAAERYVSLSRVLLVGSLLDAVLLSLGAYTLGLAGLMVAAVVSVLIKLLLLVRAGWTHGLGASLKARIDFRRLKSLLAFGFPFRVLDYPLSLFLIADLLVVSWFFSVAELAIYAMAKNFVNQVSEVGVRVGTVFGTRFMVLSGEGASKAVIGQRLQSFALFQLLVAVPLLACAGFVGVGFLVREFIPAYADGVNPFEILLITMFFMPQVAVIRFPLLYDKDLRQIGISNAVAVVSTGAFFLLAGLIVGDLTLRLVAQIMVLGYVTYFAYLMIVVGRRLWGLQRTVVNLGMVLAAAIWTTAAFEWLSRGDVSFDSVADDFLWSVLTLAKLLLLLLPVFLLGVWRAGLLGSMVSMLSGKTGKELSR